MSGKFVDVVRERDNNTTTANSMPAYKSMYNACLELFFHGASYRQRSDTDGIKLFSAAYQENAELALRILAYFRDIREGSGERRFFRTCIKFLAEEELPFNLSFIPEIGRWDDLLCLFDTPYHDYAIALVADALHPNSGGGVNKLCAKWMPRKGRQARQIREFMGIFPKDYRKLLVENTEVVETKMCNKQWGEINYAHVPSVANVKYNAAFLRNDEARRREFLESVTKGTAKINASVAFPHSIVAMLLKGGTTSLREGELLGRILQKNDTAIAMWSALPNVIGDGNKRILFCSDTSGSMGSPHVANSPILISLAMGIYCSERLQGPFKNAFITFSKTPTLQYTEGNLYERLAQIRAYHPANTDLYKIFETVLDKAKEHKLSNDDMPTDIAICSDMEFDRATGSPGDSAFKMIRKMYAESGYDMPNIIFWNVNAKSSHFPVEMNSKGVCLISGASPNAIKTFLSGITTPVEAMLKVVNTDHYAKFLEGPKELRK